MTDVKNNNEIIGKIELKTPDKEPSTNSKIDNEIDRPGKLTETIGSGENAKNSIVYSVLKWCFLLITGFLLVETIFLFIEIFNSKLLVLSDKLLECFKVVCQTIFPIVTLSLGYAFGKSQK